MSGNVTVSMEGGPRGDHVWVVTGQSLSESYFVRSVSEGTAWFFESSSLFIIKLCHKKFYF